MNEREIFEKALDLTDPDARAAFCDVACGGDSALRGRVEALLQSHEESGSFLKSPAQANSPTVDLAPSVALGTRVGPYKLLQLLGEGGMGEVYLAEQTEPVERRVAVKIIKAGMDTRQVIARFEAERQALAMMDHPNIAKVFDAGTTDTGRPYFAMEMVKGMPITQYCDEHRLEPRQRLELFQDVCHAVQHAHQKGIIHRDIKPSNVMVAEYDDRAVPKVIDFGVAKATQQRLTEKTMFTEVGTVIGTIEYMSPEQAKLNQLDIDTRSDIYSLGVLLYELLTGETPFDRQKLRSAAFDEMLRIIREDEPSRPSLKLSTSVSLPSVAASRQTEPKKLSLLISGELDWIVMKALEKERSRRYDTANAFADDIAKHLNDDAVDACPPSTGYRLRKLVRRHKLSLAIATAAALLLLTVATFASIAAIRFQKLANEKAELAEDLASAFEEANANLGLANAEQQRAEGNLDLALSALDTVYLDAIETESLLRDPRSWPQTSAAIISPSARPPLTDLERDLLQRGLKFYDQFAQQNAATPQATIQTAQAYYRVGLLHAVLGDQASAQPAYRAAIERLEELVTIEPKNVKHHRRLAQACMRMSQTIPDWNEAKPWVERSGKSLSTAIQLSPETASLYSARRLVNYQLGKASAAREDMTKAATLDQDNLWYQFLMAGDFYYYDRERARPFAERGYKLDPDGRLGLLCKSLAYPDDAPEHIEWISRAIAAKPDDWLSLMHRGQAYTSQGEHDKALADLERAAKINPEGWPLLASLARCYIDLRNYDEAERQLDRALAFHPHDFFVYGVYGRLRAAQKRYAEAVEHFSHSLRLHPGEHWLLKHRADSYTQLGQYNQALKDLNRYISSQPTKSYLYKRRAKAYFYLGRFDESLDDLKSTLKLNPDETSALVWIPLTDVARCKDEAFKKGLLELASSAFETEKNRLYLTRKRVRVFVALGETKRALEQAKRALQLGPSWRTHYQLALCQVAAGDLFGYRKTCQAMIDALADSQEPIELNFTAWTAVIAPNSLENYGPAIEAAEAAVKSSPDNEQYLQTLGAVLYRAGDAERAIEQLSMLDKPNEDQTRASTADACYFLAMAHHASGDQVQAEDYLCCADEHAQAELSDENKQPLWDRRLTLELLQSEATDVTSAAAHSDKAEPLPETSTQDESTDTIEE